jgi:hypothetical protein
MNSTLKIFIIIILLLMVSILFYITFISDNVKSLVYSCKNGKCTVDPNGKYTDSICKNECTVTPTPGPGPGPLPVDNKFTQMALTASPGTGIIDYFPYFTTDLNMDWNTDGKKLWPKNTVPNTFVSQQSPIPKNTVYRDLIIASFKNRSVLPCKDAERSKLLSYLLGVYYSMDETNLQKLTTDELKAFYRSLVFYYITTLETQPDAGWYGPYWKNRILDVGPLHDKIAGKTAYSVYKNESFLFDNKMTNSIPTTCNGYQKTNDKCPNHSSFFGDRFFSEMCQGTLRRGMRNSPQVLAENPPWAKDGIANPRYGVGGFPSDCYVECLVFPIDDYGPGGWAAGCDSTKAVCDLNPPKPPPSPVESYAQLTAGKYPEPRYQPSANSRKAGGNPICGLKAQWFYFAQGLGQFWNIGTTAYCFSYIDMFLNCPMGKITKNQVGWSSNRFGPCTDTTKFPPGSGTLGYDISNPTIPTEHDYNDQVYSMLLILEYLSRTDIPGTCKDTSCHNGLRDPRTGMIGLGYCATIPAADGKPATCPCVGNSDQATCLNAKTGGCPPNQPVTARMDATCEQVAALMGLKKGTYWKPYTIPNYKAPGGRLNSAPGVDGGALNSHGGYDPTAAWAKVRVKNVSKSNFPKRSRSDYGYSVDNREYSVGWINGHFYGFPVGKTIGASTPNPYPEGIPGTDKDGKIIYGKPNTSSDPLIYYDYEGKELYRTWHKKSLRMDEHTALLLVAEFYSCGDTGFENFKTNWPFGTYFGYGQALGGPGKAASGTLSCEPYSCTSVQFTSTATAYGSAVQPPYDFEIMYMPPVDSKSNASQCTCSTAVTLDLTADFGTENAGQDLKKYLCMNKGSTGGFVPVISPAGQSAVAFQGQNMKVTNWTTLDGTTGTFDPSVKNKFGVDSSPAPKSFCSM